MTAVERAPALDVSPAFPQDPRASTKFRSGLHGLRDQLAAGRLGRNGLFAVGQSLIVTLCVFLVYRLVVAHAGLEQLGVWSLLLAGSALVRIGDVSGAGALARFVAMRSRDGEAQSARDTVHTVMLSSFGLNVAIGFVLWMVAPLALPLFVASQYLAEADALMPYVVSSMVLGALAVAVTSGIDGTRRTDQRAMVVVSAAFVFLAASWVLVPRYGVIGFGAAQVLQQVAMLTIGWLVLRRHIVGLGWLPHSWRRDVFAETTGYALRLNAIGVIGLLFEPLAKFAFNHAGGPGLVAVYELASRLVVQVRGLVIAAAMPLIPAFAARSGPDDIEFQRLLVQATRAAAVAAIGGALAALAGAPIMSLIVLDRLSPEVLIMNAALTAGWAMNIVAIPLYFAAQAHGVLRWNFASHALIAASVLVGVFALIPLLGPAGLVSAIVAGLILSMFTVLFGNALALGATDIAWRLRWWLLGASSAVTVLCAGAWMIARAVGL